MSGKISGLLIERLPYRPSHKLVAIVIADSASRDGRNAYQSVPTIAEAAGVSERTAQRVIATLVRDGWLIFERHADGPYGTNVYRFDIGKLEAATPVGPRTMRKVQRRGDKLTPLTGDTLAPLDGETGDKPMAGRGDKPVAERGDTAMSPNPSVTVYNRPSDARARESETRQLANLAPRVPRETIEAARRAAGCTPKRYP